MSSWCSTRPTRTSPSTRRGELVPIDQPRRHLHRPGQLPRPDERSGHGQLRIPVRRSRRDHRRRLRRIAGRRSERPECHRLLRLGERGVRFDPALNAADPNLASTDYVDFPAIAVDESPGYTQGSVYVAYADFVGGGDSSVKLRLSTYTDHAFAVTEVVSPALGTGDEASLPSIAVGPDHGLSIAYSSQIGGQRRPESPLSPPPIRESTSALPWSCRRSTCPWSPAPSRAALASSGRERTVARPPVDLYSAPQLAANPVSGALYAVFVDATQGDKANVYFAQSGDRGSSWSPPVRVNDDSTTNDQFLPAVAVSPGRHAPGHRLLRSPRRRSQPARQSIPGVTATLSGATVTFGPNFRVSPAPFPVLVENPLLSPGVLLDPYVDRRRRDVLLRRIHRCARRPPRRAPRPLRSLVLTRFSRPAQRSTG